MSNENHDNKHYEVKEVKPGEFKKVKVDDNKTEHAAELSYDRNFTVDKNYNDTFTGASIIGYLALLSSIISLFSYPVTFGLIGIVLGFVAVSSHAKTLGYWAIGIGVVTAVTRLFFRVALLSFVLSLFR